METVLRSLRLTNDEMKASAVMWWVIIVGVGVLLGGIGAWATGGTRVFLRTLAPPVILIALSLVFTSFAPPLSRFWPLLAGLLTLTVTAFASDYCIGFLLGRHGKDGFRADSVGH